jgi:hypothetical protein
LYQIYHINLIIADISGNPKLIVMAFNLFCFGLLSAECLVGKEKVVSSPYIIMMFDISTWKENCNFCHYVLLCLLEI